MGRLIELGASIGAAICAADEYDGGYNFERDRKIRDALMALPPVDAVPVVRCKDCRWRDDQRGSTAWMPCRALVTPDDFSCVVGERKDGEHETDQC